MSEVGKGDKEGVARRTKCLATGAFAGLEVAFQTHRKITRFAIKVSPRGGTHGVVVGFIKQIVAVERYGPGVIHAVGQARIPSGVTGLFELDGLHTIVAALGVDPSADAPFR